MIPVDYLTDINPDNEFIVGILDHEGRPRLPVYRIGAQSLYDLLQMHCGDISVPGASSHVHRDKESVLIEYKPAFVHET